MLLGSRSHRQFRICRPVRICPCIIPLEVIPFGPYSVARDFDSPAKLSLTVFDNSRFVIGCLRVVEVMNISRPHRLSTISGTTPLASLVALIRSSLTPKSQSESLNSARVPGLGGPVL